MQEGSGPGHPARLPTELPEVHLGQLIPRIGNGIKTPLLSLLAFEAKPSACEAFREQGRAARSRFAAVRDDSALTAGRISDLPRAALRASAVDYLRAHQPDLPSVSVGILKG